MRFVKHRRKAIVTGCKCLSALLITIFVIGLTRDQPFEYDYRDKEKAETLKPWFFEGGTVRPTHYNEHLKLWPEQDKGDRISEQLMFTPKAKPKVKKKIFVEKLQLLSMEKGSRIFDELDCPVKECEIVENSTEADAVVFEDFVTRVRDSSSLNQIWILHLLESPLFSGKVIQETSVNWTASYRLNSDIVTPYDKWVYYNDTNRITNHINYAEGRTKKVAWFVSNCHSRNKRLEYAQSLRRYISVDIYGLCGEKACPKAFEETCREMISRDYKFYLSFENSNCRDYITEKFYLNGLRLGVIPIVMGAPKEDYEKVAPANSFIHVEDFQSPKHLAEYLHYLNQNDEAYNSYFMWKGMGEFINTYFMCRLCAMLHADRPNHFYKKITRWWRKPGTCTKTFWNNLGDIAQGIHKRKQPATQRGLEELLNQTQQGRF